MIPSTNKIMPIIIKKYLLKPKKAVINSNIPIIARLMRSVLSILHDVKAMCVSNGLSD